MLRLSLIVEDVKDEFRSDINTETQEKPSEGGFFSRLVKGLLKTKQNIGAGFRAFFLGKKIDDDLFEEANNLSGDSDDDIDKDKSNKK